MKRRAAGCLTCTSFLGRFYAGHLLCEGDGGRGAGDGLRVLDQGDRCR